MLTVVLVDLEASSLHPTHSYPIELGWGVAGRRPPKSCLICPEEEWIDWDPESQEVHGIRRLTLLEQGLPPREVCARLLNDVGKMPLYSDASGADQFWLSRLFDAGRVPELCPRVLSLQQLLGSTLDLDAGGWEEAKWRASAVARRTHRAAEDVAYLMAIVDAAIEITADSDRRW